MMEDNLSSDLKTIKQTNNSTMIQKESQYSVLPIKKLAWVIIECLDTLSITIKEKLLIFQEEETDKTKEFISGRSMVEETNNGLLHMFQKSLI